MKRSIPKPIDGTKDDTILSDDSRIMSEGVALTNSVQRKRTARGWSQAELAKRSRVSRAAVSAIEVGRLTPSVTAALSLAQVLECTVEELFGARPAAAVTTGTWAWRPWSEPCRYWEAELWGRCVLFPVEEMAMNPQPQDGRWCAGVCHDVRNEAAGMTLTVATCDPAAGLLAREYERETGFRMLVFPRGGAAGLDLVRRRLIHVAALHRSTRDAPERNAATVREQLGGHGRLLRVAQWEAGMALPPGGRVGSLRTLSRRVRQWALREPGSAARECLDDLLDGRTPAGRVVHGHTDVAGSVRAGWAEAGVCVKVSAMEARLDFQSLRSESLDFCFHEGLENDPRIQALIRILQGRRYRQILAELPGYEAGLTGELACA